MVRSRKKRKEIPGQYTLFEFMTIVDLASPIPKKETVKNTVSSRLLETLRKHDTDDTHVLRAKSRPCDDADENTDYLEGELLIFSKKTKGKLQEHLKKIAPEYILKISDGIKFVDTSWYFITDVFEKPKRQREEHLKADLTLISGSVPKSVRERTEMYLNAPYSLNLIDAFKKAAGECKKPSKKLKDAIERENYKAFIPSAYTDKTTKAKKVVRQIKSSFIGY